MTDLAPETVRLAERLAAALHVPVGEAVRRAIEASAVRAGIPVEPTRKRRRLTVAEMLAVGGEIAAMPLLDQRTPHEIMDDLNRP